MYKPKLFGCVRLNAIHARKRIMSRCQKALETRAPYTKFSNHIGIISDRQALLGHASFRIGVRVVNTYINFVFDQYCCQIENFLTGKGTKKGKGRGNRYLFYTFFDTLKAIEKSIFSYISVDKYVSFKLKKLLVATNNPGKLAELRDLLAGLPVELHSLQDFKTFDEVEETGVTFVENARLKAGGYATQTGMIAIADDSGLEVVALGDRPGVLSARYGGADTSFDEKMVKLLGELDKTGDTSRKARFVCAMAIADPSGKILYTTEGICPGKIAAAPRGQLGFGYDPLFIPNRFDLTFGELSGEIKRKISHRARAFEQIIPFLRDFIAV